MQHAVHPRLRGEHRLSHVIPQIHNGSSPPARGTSIGIKNASGLNRFIPACAGNIPKISRIIIQPPVHPRLRGEHNVAPYSPQAKNGSSPPARGTCYITIINPISSRFIPACAGNILSPSFSIRRTPVHPRLRGEHKTDRGISTRGTGSSPPARGTFISAPLSLTDTRFIPACAGNINSPCILLNVLTVHPRLRGEHS